jgi:hypothetical protein
MCEALRCFLRVGLLKSKYKASPCQPCQACNVAMQQQTSPGHRGRMKSRMSRVPMLALAKRALPNLDANLRVSAAWHGVHSVRKLWRSLCLIKVVGLLVQPTTKTNDDCEQTLKPGCTGRKGGGQLMGKKAWRMRGPD